MRVDRNASSPLIVRVEGFDESQGDEECITNARVEHGSAREESVGEPLVNKQKADLVAGVLLAACERAFDLAHLLPNGTNRE